MSGKGAYAYRTSNTEKPHILVVVIAQSSVLGSESRHPKIKEKMRPARPFTRNYASPCLLFQIFMVRYAAYAGWAAHGFSAAQTCTEKTPRKLARVI